MKKQYKVELEKTAVKLMQTWDMDMDIIATMGHVCVVAARDYLHMKTLEIIEQVIGDIHENDLSLTMYNEPNVGICISCGEETTVLKYKSFSRGLTVVLCGDGHGVIFGKGKQPINIGRYRK